MPPPPSSTYSNPQKQMTVKRIHRELTDLQREDLGDITLGLASDSDIYAWRATIPGPAGSCYEGGVFVVDLKLAQDYPFTAPKATFVTMIYHMNISDAGSVCIDILKSSWSPALSVFKVILSLSSLLTDPNPKDPLVPSIAMQYVRNRNEHDKTAREWTKLYAQPRPPKELTPPPQILVQVSPWRYVDGGRRAIQTATRSVDLSDIVATMRRSRPRQEGPIMIDVDEANDDVDSSASASGRRASGGSSTLAKRRRDGSETEVEVMVNDAGSANATSGERKRKVPRTRSRGSSGSSTSVEGEVIVIDD